MVLHTDGEQKRRGKQDERDMAIPPDATAYFIVVEPKIFRIFQIHFDTPACSNGQNHRLQTGLRRGEDEVVRFLERCVEAPTDDEKVASVDDGAMDLCHDGPIKESLPFGSLTHTQALPLQGPIWQQALDGGHLAHPVSQDRVDTNHFLVRDRKCKGKTLVVQESTQVRTVPIDGIANHPTNRQRGADGSLKQVLGQLRFGLKMDPFGDMSGLPARGIIAPFFRDVQGRIHQRMSQSRYVGQYVELTLVTLKNGRGIEGQS